MSAILDVPLGQRSSNAEGKMRLGLSPISRAIILGHVLGSVSLKGGYPLIEPGWWKGVSQLTSSPHAAICFGSMIFIA